MHLKNRLFKDSPVKVQLTSSSPQRNPEGPCEKAWQHIEWRRPGCGTARLFVYSIRVVSTGAPHALEDLLRNLGQNEQFVFVERVEYQPPGRR